MRDQAFEALSNATGIPLLLFQGDTLLQQWGGMSFHPSPVWYLMRSLPADAPAVCWRISPEFLLAGRIQLPDGLVLLAGPVSDFTLSTEQCRHLLLAMGQQPSRTEELSIWLNQLTACSAQRFQAALQVLAGLVFHGEAVTPQQLPSPEPPLSPAVYQLPGRMPPAVTINPDFEHALVTAVMHGAVEDVQRMLHGLQGGLPPLADDPLHTFSRVLTMLATVVSRAAMRGGLDYTFCLVLTDRYLHRAAQLHTFEELRLLLQEMVLDFTRRVAHCRIPQTQSPLVPQVDRYIRAHLHEPIHTQQIAQALQLSSAHLCRHFRQHTGMTLTAYIHQVKTSEAQYLLEATSQPVAAIAASLGFSSQQYFDTVFRRITGQSPKAYRQSSRN